MILQVGAEFSVKGASLKPAACGSSRQIISASCACTRREKRLLKVLNVFRTVGLATCYGEMTRPKSRELLFDFARRPLSA